MTSFEPRDFTKEEFAKLWPDGYSGDVAQCTCRRLDSAQLRKVLESYSTNAIVCEIGPGGGFWTTSLLQAKELWLVDVIAPKKEIITISAKPHVHYIELPTASYSLPGIADNCIDFLFCFDVFCHLSAKAQREYLHSITRVLKCNGTAIVMFAEWDKHEKLSTIKNKDPYRQSPEKCGWFWWPWLEISQFADECDLDVVDSDMYKGSRDRLVRFARRPRP